MRKQIALITFTFLALWGLFFGGVEAQEPEDLLPEPTCIAFSASGSAKQICNRVCERQCVENGQGCAFGEPSRCKNLSESDWNEVVVKVRPAYNIFSVELCPDPDLRPADDPYCTIVIVRLAFYAVISILIFILVLMAMWVVWERSTAADSPEKVEKAVTIAKNAITGVLITLLFVVIVQVASLLLGLTGSLFDITIVPQPKVVPDGGRCDAGYVVCETGSSCEPGFGGEYYCEK